MITAIVQFPLPAGTTLEQAEQMFQSTAPRYREIAGLVRKYYLFDPEKGTGGGCYLFASRADAEALFGDAWRALIMEKYSAEPAVSYFETPVVVDNAGGESVGIAAE